MGLSSYPPTRPHTVGNNESASNCFLVAFHSSIIARLLYYFPCVRRFEVVHKTGVLATMTIEAMRTRAGAKVDGTAKAPIRQAHLTLSHRAADCSMYSVPHPTGGMSFVTL